MNWSPTTTSARAAARALTSEATQIGLVGEDGQRAVAATIRSGFQRAGQRMIPTGYGAASPGDYALQRAVCAEIEGGARGETATRVKLADCGKSQAGELLAGLASALGSAAAADGCVFVFAERDPAGFSRWAIASQLPAAWPQTTCTGSVPVALTRSPLATPAEAPSAFPAAGGGR